MLLPHGYDGAGPEHSSSKIERFLQLSNDAPTDINAGNINLIVANPSTPAQLFHLLRRQMLRNYRKPLIVASPKGLLRAPAAASALSEMGPGTSFQPVLDLDTNPHSPDRVILCSGKHFYTLSEALSSRSANIALVRVEELSPFPRKELQAVLERYSDAEVVWAQEEPENQGPWTFVRPRVEDAMREAGMDGPVMYRGRPSCATVAVGVGSWHKQEAAQLVEAALSP